jgi:5'(3')-deoxyribonucleotidase
MGMRAPIVHIDMDGTIVDFLGFFEAHPEERPEGDLDGHPSVFERAEPLPGAIEAVLELDRHFEVHILTKSPWGNDLAPSQKLAWIKRHFEAHASHHPDGRGRHVFYKRVTISHNKQLLKGDYLIDDRAEQYPDFEGKLIHIGGKTAKGDPCSCRGEHPLTWSEVVALLLRDLDR